ncbi:MAG: prepilin-type N-terminal cleavage/methylation domain-containing protein [Candidatus Saccharibacteria bacterium]
MKSKSNSNSNSKRSAFTIVELLVVIVVIGILAAITIISYTGISKKATEVSLKSDLSGASKQLEMYKVDNSQYPSYNNCSSNPPAKSICLKSSGNNNLEYIVSGSSPQTYILKNTNASTSYLATESTTPTVIAVSCPTGFIKVPGSVTYGTSDFCVMKYEAKNVSGVATSQAALTAWVNISQTSAISTAAAVCTGCHLITESEWMTIAQNVLSVPTNWSGGSVGSGFIYSGHNDSAPASILAVTNSADGYSDTGNVSPSNQKRTLTLTNDEVIWDLAGNTYEWTSGQTNGINTQQPGVTGAGYAWREWNIVNNPGTISPNPSASATGITGASSWTSGNGIGNIYSSVLDSSLRGFFRGGYWGFGVNVGVLTFYSTSNPDTTMNTIIGFRVVR